MHPRGCTHRRAPPAWHPRGATSAEPPRCAAPIAVRPRRCTRCSTHRGARTVPFPCHYPLRGCCAKGARARQGCLGGGVHPESPAAAASTPLSVAQPRAQRGRYLRGPRCQGKAGLAPKLRVGFCSRWKGPRFRCCLASCSLLRGGGGCCGLVPGSREDAGAGLRAGRAPGAGWGARGGPRARGLGAKPLVPLS